MGNSYTTHVANATGEKIFARVAEDKIVVESLGAGVNGKVGVFKGFKGEIDVHGDAKFHIGKLLHDGFVAIGSRDYLPFPANKEPYVSVVTESGYMVSHNYRPGRDISVIVTADLTIKPTKYGHIWIDMDGKHH